MRNSEQRGHVHRRFAQTLDRKEVRKKATRVVVFMSPFLFSSLTCYPCNREDYSHLRVERDSYCITPGERKFRCDFSIAHFEKRHY
jgi:hypothetical protein